jgi:hypothetical protein
MPRYKGIYKRKNKQGRYTWYAQYVHNYKKYHIPWGYRTAEEAARAREQFIKKFRSDKTIDKEKITVLEFAKIFLEKYGSRWKDSTFIGKESIVRNHIVEILGDRRIGDIDPEDIQELSNHLYKKKLGTGAI